eukprot:1159597-Pelagomonas_calceolata.AAC.8
MGCKAKGLEFLMGFRAKEGASKCPCQGHAVAAGPHPCLTTISHILPAGCTDAAVPRPLHCPSAWEPQLH